jgi:hypothetical protein
MVKAPIFVCSSGKVRPALGCHQWSVTEAEYLPMVIEALVREVDTAILEASKDPRWKQECCQRLRQQTNQLERLLANVWDDLGGDEAGMVGRKLIGRMEQNHIQVQKWLANSSSGSHAYAHASNVLGSATAHQNQPTTCKGGGSFLY